MKTMTDTLTAEIFGLRSCAPLKNPGSAPACVEGQGLVRGERARALDREDPPWLKTLPSGNFVVGH